MKQFEGMNVSQARKDKKESEEENDLDLKNRRGPKAQKEKPLKEVCLYPKFCTLQLYPVVTILATSPAAMFVWCVYSWVSTLAY